MNWWPKLKQKWLKKQITTITEEIDSDVLKEVKRVRFLIKVKSTYKGDFVVEKGVLKGGINIDPPVGTITPLYPGLDPAKVWPIWQLVDGHFVSGIVYPELDEIMWDKENQRYLYGGAPFSRLIKLPNLSE